MQSQSVTFVWVRFPQGTMLRTCPNMTQAVEWKENFQLDQSSHIFKKNYQDAGLNIIDQVILLGLSKNHGYIERSFL